MSDDTEIRFIFDDTDVRGDLVRISDAYRAIIDIHDYPDVVSVLLGEFLVASLLLSSTIKFKGRLVLQVKSQGQIPLLMAEATHDKKIRGIVKLADTPDPTADFDVLFAKGTLAVTIEPDQGERYQSLVPLDGDNLAACLAHYFQQSEQLNTYITLAAGNGIAAGLLIQQLPRQVVTDEIERRNQWRHLSILASTAKATELTHTAPIELLANLFVQERLRLFDSSSVQFHCSCSAERMAAALISLGDTDLQSLFEEDPRIEIDCEFCRTHYEFTPESLTSTIAGGKVH